MIHCKKFKTNGEGHPEREDKTFIEKIKSLIKSIVKK